MKYKKHSLIVFVCGCMAAALFSNGTSAGRTLPEPAATNNETISAGGITSTVDARTLMSRVASKYRAIASFRCRGKSQHRSSLDGTEKRDRPIAFEIDYTRGSSSYIRWEQDDEKKLFTTSGANAWLDVDGRRIRDFSTSRDGLMTVSFADGGWSLFGISVFVFRDA
jgi:hypothetical protein